MRFGLFSGLLLQFRILGAVTRRSLIVDLRYKFQLAVEGMWTALNVVVFVLLGVAWQQTAQIVSVPYNMVSFFIIATGFFTVFSGIMETTVVAISEENQLGTMGFLITNSVSPISIIIGRYLSATFRWMIIFITIVIPPIVIKGIVPSTFAILWSTILVFTIAWLFFLGFTLLLTSVALIFKKTTTLNRVGIYIVRFAAGAFVPIISFDQSFSFFGKPLSNILIWFPPAFALESIKWLFTLKSTSDIHCGTCGPSKDGLTYIGFNKLFGTATTTFQLNDPMIQKMFLISIIFLAISLLVVSWLTKLARKWGTIEFY